MLKKSVMFFIALLMVSGSYAVDAFAAPSVKKLGTVAGGVSNAAKPVTVLPKQQASNPSNDSLQAKAAVVPVSKESVDGSFRLSGVNTMKTISTGKIAPVVSGQPVVSGVSAEEFNRAVDRIDALESQNILTGVERDGADGNYVTDVTTNADGSIVKVKKTNLIVAPVRTASFNASTAEEGEIWLVK